MKGSIIMCADKDGHENTSKKKCGQRYIGIGHENISQAGYQINSNNTFFCLICHNEYDISQIANIGDVDNCKNICLRCAYLKGYYERCSECHSLFPISDLLNVGADLFCPVCFEEKAWKCQICGTYHSEPHCDRSMMICKRCEQRLEYAKLIGEMDFSSYRTRSIQESCLVRNSVQKLMRSLYLGKLSPDDPDGFDMLLIGNWFGELVMINDKDLPQLSINPSVEKYAYECTMTQFKRERISEHELRKQHNVLEVRNWDTYHLLEIWIEPIRLKAHMKHDIEQKIQHGKEFHQLSRGDENIANFYIIGKLISRV